MSSPPPWPKLKSEPGPNLMICRARVDTLTNPRTGEALERVVLETPDWCNVVAFTPEGRLIVVRQFRFGSESVTTEIPGGMVDRGETPLQAAQRELREEAGYTADSWVYLGAVEPNPAFHDNLCHHWLAMGARRTHEQQQDSGEDIAVDTLALDEVRRQISSGEIRHALVLTALARVLDLRMDGTGPTPRTSGF